MSAIICPRCHGYDPGVPRSELPDGAHYCTPLSCDAWVFTARLTKDGPKPIRADGRAAFTAFLVATEPPAPATTLNEPEGEA